MSLYDALNERQREAVLHTEGPELILAGAGSGKTRVLTYRIACLIGEKSVSPWNIMAITFTNKAAGEMRERVDRLVGAGSGQIWVATFHSSCVRILRRFIDRLGFDQHFAIYDAEDQRTAMKQVLKEMGAAGEGLKERGVLAAVSAAKNELITAERYGREAVGRTEERIGECYKKYQQLLRKNNALDFDDLIMKTVELLRAEPEVLDYYQERFRYIMVDEYQDTNTAQFQLIRLLAEKYRNLCVVGDDDQSIYKFRGANIHNILNFESAFPGAKVVKLEQNYRSTGNILEAANEVIRNNRGRKEKRLWTEEGRGEPVRELRFETAQNEAEAIASEIRDRGEDGRYGRFAVLYRTNAQSRLLEERFVYHGIPYQLVGGVNFYQRKEIKDLLAYLKVVANGRDELSVRRILNVPKRGIGAATEEKAAAFAAANGLDYYEGLERAAGTGALGRSGERVLRFTEMIGRFRERSAELPPGALLQLILEESGYREALKAEGEIEAESRLENIDELISKAVSFENEAGEDGGSDAPLLDRFLEEVALIADIDRMDEGGERVTLMTLHAAKGLEFDEVYISGMEEGLFPGRRSMDDPEELEEERRLCYVGITRARKRLSLSSARSRMINGETHWSRESMFLHEIPEALKRTENRGGAIASGGFRFGGEEGRIDRGFFGDDSWKNAYGADFSQGRAAARGAGEGGGFFGRKRPGKPAAFGKAFQVVKSERLDYAEGDRVLHARFGAGTVLKIEDGKKDYEVTVSFDGHGVKKMLACFAKLQKC